MPVECPNLKSLFINGSNLRNLYLGISPHLETLNLKGCNELVELHMPDECPKLKHVALNYSKLSHLYLGVTPLLETLNLGICSELVELHMPIECPKLNVLNLCCSKVTKLNLELTTNLVELNLEECSYLKEIHAPAGCLEKIVKVRLSGCPGFGRLVCSNNYAPPYFHLPALELIAESIDVCPLHPNNSLPKFQFNCLYDEPSPSSNGNIEKLLSFGQCVCTNLESFSARICGLQHIGKLTLEGSFPEVPKDLYQLVSLEELTLSMQEIKQLPNSICMLKHLKYLNLRSCWLLEQLPNDLGQLECLEMLILKDCISLRDLPNNICKMKCLEYLHIPYCILVDKLPEELGRLECLKELNLEGTYISFLPQTIYESKGLRIIGSRWQLASYGFTSFSTDSRNKTCCYV